jgi:hypothetical protein
MSSLLIVEDELLVAQSIATLLEANGHQVIACVDTAADAVAAATRQRPDLVLMDIHLRGEPDGIEAARLIRARVDVPVVFLTAYNDRAQLDRAKLSEPHGYLLKPYGDRDLLTTVEVVVHKHQAERGVRASERWLGTTLRSIGDAVIGVDAAGRVQLVNRIAEQLTGWSHAEAAGRPLHEVLRLLAEDSRAPRRLPIAEAMADGSVRGTPGPTVLVARDGRERPIDESVAAIADEDGRVFGAVVVFHDVGERRALEARVALADRMTTLATLTAGLGHELNNPLSYNLTNLETVLEGWLPRLRAQLAPLAYALGADGAAQVIDTIVEIEGALADARTGAERMRDLLGTIRGFVRPDGAEPRPVDLVEVVESALRLTRNELAVRTGVVTDLRARPFVRGHAGQLVQVVANVLLNAAQAIPAGTAADRPVRVTVDAADRDAVIEVSDPGVGIAPELMVRVFEPFFTAKPVGMGSGLGLAIVHHLVTQHGGEVAVTSRVGHGSTFRITLPRIEAPASTAPHAPAASAAPPPRRRVLIVDDDERVGRALTAILRADHDVVFITSPLAAQARLAAESFDVVVFDLMMPELTGMELHAAIARTHPELAARALFVTGGAFTGETQAFVAAMGDRVLVKPVRAPELKAAIARACLPR